MPAHPKAILAGAIIISASIAVAPANATPTTNSVDQHAQNSFPVPKQATQQAATPPEAPKKTISEQIGDATPSPKSKPGEAIILSRSWTSLLEQCNLTPEQTRCVIQMPISYDSPTGKQIIGMMLYSPKSKDNQLYVVISQKTDTDPVIYYPANNSAKNLLESGNILDAGIAGLTKENPEKVQCTQENNVCAYKINMTTGNFPKAFDEGYPLILSISFAHSNHQIPMQMSEMPNALKALSQDQKRTY